MGHSPVYIYTKDSCKIPVDGSFLADIWGKKEKFVASKAKYFSDHLLTLIKLCDVEINKRDLV